MKFNLLLPFFLVIIGSTQLLGQCGNLYIGGVIDGPLSGGVPKGIQICASGNVADLSIYGIGSANNGGGSDGEEFTFPALSISAGDCFWLGSNTTSWITWFGFDPCFTNSAANINGDDAIELFCSGSVEDLFGDINVDGSGQCWEYMDGWAVNNNSSPNFGTFSCGDWTFSGPNALDGETSNASATTPYPSPAQTCPSTLPVSLISFSVNSRNSSNELSWATASEQNNYYFSIEHSIDGRSFEEIDRVNGVGTSNIAQNYTFVHKQPKDGLNYYRLKQVDLDGRFEYSHVIKVENKSNKIKVFPTSITNAVNIEIEDSESAKLTIVNRVGRTIKVVSLNSSFNTIDLSELPSGIYYAKVESTTRYIVEQIVKF